MTPFLQITTDLIYRMAHDVFCDSPPLEGLKAVWADQSNVDRLFRADTSRRRRFLAFLEKGHVGHIYTTQGLHDDTLSERWAAYAWLAPAGVEGPYHLPRSVREFTAPWVHYCHTCPEFRGRGLYKAGLRRLVEHARAADPNGTVYIDTGVENQTSRAAILGSGFTPCGVIDRTTIRLPRLVTWSSGPWRRGVSHPVLSTRGDLHCPAA